MQAQDRRDPSTGSRVQSQSERSRSVSAPLEKTKYPGIYKRGTRYVARFGDANGKLRWKSAATIAKASGSGGGAWSQVRVLAGPSRFSTAASGISSHQISERGEMLGVYTGLGVSLLLALLFGRADRRRR